MARKNQGADLVAEEEACGPPPATAGPWRDLFPGEDHQGSGELPSGADDPDQVNPRGKVIHLQFRGIMA